VKQTRESPPPNTQTPLQPPTVDAKGLIIASVTTSFFLLVLAMFLAYQNYQLRQQLTQIQTQPSPSPSPVAKDKDRNKINCKDPRPEVCTMECIQNPPYICGSDGKSYCTACQACANKEVVWYEIRASACGE
jgi:hypothetical protein